MSDMTRPDVVVAGAFDDPRSHTIRLLEEASRLGNLTALLLPDNPPDPGEEKPIKFPIEERLYLLNAVRFVDRVIVAPPGQAPDELPLQPTLNPDIWVVSEEDDSHGKKDFCRSHGISYRVMSRDELKGFPAWKQAEPDGKPPHPKVVVTGCYDWFHSGHVRFFEEVSELGDLYVIVGNDTNVRFLKGEGHPLFPQDMRQYMVQSIRYVCRAMITSGMGWMDAEPEIDLIKPDMYAVNEDGDKPEKRQFCLDHGIGYVVLKRTPKPGLPRRQSTDLRGF